MEESKSRSADDEIKSDLYYLLFIVVEVKLGFFDPNWDLNLTAQNCTVFYNMTCNKVKFTSRTKLVSLVN